MSSTIYILYSFSRLAKLSENGGLSQLWKREMDSSLEACGQGVKFEPLGFENLLFAFLVLGAAYITSLLIMGIEMSMSGRSRNSQYTRRQQQL